jgi:hypothetical protein
MYEAVTQSHNISKMPTIRVTNKIVQLGKGSRDPIMGMSTDRQRQVKNSSNLYS